MFRTTSQKKAICTNCPLAKTANIIGDAVILIILRELFTGKKRFKDFENKLDSVSTRTISDKLKTLEQEGIISREEFSEKPPRVEYTLSKKGLGLKPILTSTLKYGEMFLK